MMAAKARLFGDEETRREILRSANPAEPKALGRRVRGFDRARWEDGSFGVVYVGKTLKFGASSPLQRAPLATEDCTLLEASPMDRIWGIGLAAEDDRALRRAA